MGGTRFIGRHVVKQLLTDNHQVTVFNRGFNNQILPSSVQKYTGDRKNKEDLSILFQNNSFDALIDLSAYFVEDLEALLFFAKNKIGQYIFCSTAMVYNFNEPKSEKIVFWESDYNKNSDEESYGFHKRQCEIFLSRNLDTKLTILRPTYVYGPFDYTNRLFKLFSWAKTKTRISIPKLCLSRRTQMVYAPDLAKAFSCTLDNPDAYGKAFNIANNEVVNYHQLVELAIKCTGKNVELVSEKLSENDFPFLLNFDTIINTGFTSQQLKFEPENSYLAGLQETYDWYMKNNKS